jgi:hypothetical protein
MKKIFMKRIIYLVVFTFLITNCTYAQDLKTIKLSEPNKKGGLSVSEALSLRASVREWSDKNVSLEALSDLLWAANVINRENKKRTAASAQNAQDVDIYVFMKDGVYVYDVANHALNLIESGDHQSEIGMMRKPGAPGPGGNSPGKPENAQGGNPHARPEGMKEPAPGAMPPPPGGMGKPSPVPIDLLLVSDYSKFGGGTEVLKRQWGAIDAGLVAQNVMLFCAAHGLVTHPRAAIEESKIKTLLKLKDTQLVLLELPIGYPKQ